MESEFIKHLNKFVAENPELFEALMEFERTGKVPKLNRKKHIDLTIDEDVLRKFKAYCQKQGYNMSKLIEKHMVEELTK
ncbi:MAG: hypothetical protein QW331_02040 [Candidatus Woesearchaeota archaeon]